MEVRVGVLRNGKAVGKDEVTGEIFRSGRELMIDNIWRLCNMTFDSGVVSEDWISAVTVPLYKG